ENDDFMVAVPRRAAQRRQARRGNGPQVAPGVFGEIVAPDGGVVQIDFAKPLPAVIAAETLETQESAAGRIEDVLLGAADARRREIRLAQLPLRSRRIIGPRLRILLTAAALIVPSPADDFLGNWVVAKGRFITEAGRARRVLERAAFDPGVGFLRQCLRGSA